MKKIFSFILFLSLVFALAACDEKEPEVKGKTDLEKVTEAKEDLTIGGISALTVDLVLPSTGMNDTVITWASDNEAVVSSAGVVTRPVFEDGDGTAKLTATITLNDESMTKEFTVTVTKLDEVIIVVEGAEEVASAKEALSLGDLTAVTGKLNLVKFGPSGTRVSWESTDELVIDLAGFVSQPAFHDGDATVTLTATITRKDATDTKEFVITVPKAAENAVTSTVALPFESLAEEYIVADGTINVHYMNNGALPYVDVQEFITLLSGAIISDEITVAGTGDALSVSYVITDEDLEEDFTLSTVYDFGTNVLTVNDFSVFDNLSEETQTDFGSGLETVDYVTSDPNEVVIDFDDYDFDFVRHNDKYLIPLHIANLFYSGSMYDVYYNGDKVYGIDTYQLMDDSGVSELISTSSLNAADMPEDVRAATYDYMAFIFDYFYGLKAEQSVDTYYDKLVDFQTNYMLQSDPIAYDATFNFIYQRDDLHTSHMFTGIYEDHYDKGLSWDDLGSKTTKYYEASDAMGGSCNNKQPYATYDNDTIGVIFIEGFEAETPDEFEASVNALLAIPTIETIVMDLSCNGGGILGAAFQILGFLTDDPVAIHSKDTTDLSTDSWYMSTANAAVDVEWYILTSTLTFSAANLTTSVAKDMGIATIIGTDSSGGACSITAMLLPDGSGIMISSTGMLTDDDYNSIEAGIDVDILMQDPTDMAELVTLINANNAE